jgi:hypothetical protein
MFVLFSTLDAPWTPVAWNFLALFGFLGALALVSPRWFAALANRGGQQGQPSQRAEVEPAMALADASAQGHHRAPPHCRLVGGAVVAATSALSFLLACA